MAFDLALRLRETLSMREALIGKTVAIGQPDFN